MSFILKLVVEKMQILQKFNISEWWGFATMVELASNLRALEGLLEEFFGPQTGNARKQEIEKVLGAFTSQPTAWRDCLYFLSHSGNHFVAMFSLTTLETFIHRRWVGMLGVDRAEIRTSLHRLLFQVECELNVLDISIYIFLPTAPRLYSSVHPK